MLYEFSYKKFKEIDITDNFFDSLKSYYDEFEELINKQPDDYAYIQIIDDKIEGFLYLKIEKGPIKEINSAIMFQKILNIKMIKMSFRETTLGERFIKKSIDFAIMNDIDHIYIGLPEDNQWIINLFKKYGFIQCGTKKIKRGNEIILLKDIELPGNDIRLSYPKIDLNNKAYILPMLRDTHDRYFPSSIIKNETTNIAEDNSYTNTIEKLHLTRMDGVENLKKGDLVLIYRKADALVPAEYRSAVTYICVIDEARANNTFVCFEDYKEFCKEYDSYNENELYYAYYRKHEFYTIKMTLNVAMKKRITRHDLIENMNLCKDSYWGFFEVSRSQLEGILEMGEVKEGYIKR